MMGKLGMILQKERLTRKLREALGHCWEQTKRSEYGSSAESGLINVKGSSTVSSEEVVKIEPSLIESQTKLGAPRSMLTVRNKSPRASEWEIRALRLLTCDKYGKSMAIP
jgi:hypothetical protein